MFPEELGSKSAEEAYGVGMISYVPVESQVIEIADDGESAKGLWNVRGSTCHLTSQGPIAKWIFGWAAVDFVREDGEWKILNLLLVFNIDHQCGVAFTEAEKEFPEVAEFAGDEVLPNARAQCKGNGIRDLSDIPSRHKGPQSARAL